MSIYSTSFEKDLKQLILSIQQYIQVEKEKHKFDSISKYRSLQEVVYSIVLLKPSQWKFKKFPRQMYTKSIQYKRF